MEEEIRKDEQLPVNPPGNKEIPDLYDLVLTFYGRIKKIASDKRLFKAARSVFITLSAVVSIVFVMVFILYFVPFITEKIPVNNSEITNDQEFRKDPLYRKEITLINRDIQRLSRKYTGYTSGQSYIVINTTRNKFSLYRNKKVVREGFCSSGSYTLLKTAEGDRKWIFRTPKGKYRIQGKTTNPVWKKPDWAFVEEGLPVPPINHHTRFEYGVLGDYALAIGDGYLIHGTLYKRFLGMPVTHGCVRLNDEDLEAIFNTLSVGSKVYIF